MAINNLNTGVGISPTIVDAKGDLIVATGADAVNRLAVGTANQQLVVDSSTSTGLKWNNPSGMVLLNTTSFSGVASQAVSTVFSATYENYRIIVTLSGATADAAINMKLRNGVTDSSVNYSTGLPGLTEAGGANNQFEANTTTGFRINAVDNGANGDYYGTSIDLYKPFTSQRSAMSLTGVGINAAGTFFGFAGGGQHTVASSFDGINIIASAGNISGKVFIYGYNL